MNKDDNFDGLSTFILPEAIVASFGCASPVDIVVAPGCSQI